MNTMRKLMLGFSAVALTAGGVAFAQAPAAGEANRKPRMERPKVDADGDGAVSRSEAQAAATSHFARLDADRNGKIDQADAQLRHQQRREKMFARLDTDDNGAISKAEFAAKSAPGGKDGPMAGERRGGKMGHARGMGDGGPRGRMMAMARHADSDRDGAISQAEFAAAAAKRFDAQDANRDGKVTREERQAARQAHMEQRRAKWEARKADKPAAN